jgi:hypothetical protein
MTEVVAVVVKAVAEVVAVVVEDIQIWWRC